MAGVSLSYLTVTFVRDATPHTNSIEPEYDVFNQEQNVLAASILIYKINGTPEIYHTIKDVEVISADGYRVFDTNEHEIYDYAMSFPDGYAQTMRVYLTNSNFTSERFSGLMCFRNLWKVSLSPSNLDFLSKKYFSQLYHINLFNEASPPDRIRNWLNIVYKKRTSKDFQALCDILYFHKLLLLNKSDSYFAKIDKTIQINIEYPHMLIDYSYPQFHSYKSIEEVPDQQKWMYKLYKYSESLSVDSDFYQDRYIRLLYVYLLLELSADSNNADYAPLSHAKSLKGLKQCIQNHIDELENSDYLAGEFNQIKKLSSFLQRMKKQTNTVPEKDGAYRQILSVPKNNEKLFKDFIAYIKEEYDKPNSFLLRYLKFNFCGMSSGERAFQNFFSWINLITEFKKIDSGNSFEMPKNLFLLIDEIDLYMHPEWQQKFVKNLLEEVNAQFQGHSVQIVFATHSPLCLSDIPCENCIYLDKKNSENTVISRNRIKQTFGRDIYTLLNDAFFMGSVSMGAFASDYIKRIIERINLLTTDTSEDEIKGIKEDISFIGNDLISNKLEQMINIKKLGPILSRKAYLENELKKINEAIEEQ